MESTLEDYLDSDEFLELRKEMEESIEAAQEKYIEESTDLMMAKYKDEFDRAENGEKAEKLFRKKFPVYLRENLTTSENGITFVTFRFKTLKSEGGEDVFYVENIDIVNREPDLLEDSSGKPKEEFDEMPSFDKKVDPALIGKKESAEVAGLVGKSPEGRP